MKVLLWIPLAIVLEAFRRGPLGGLAVAPDPLLGLVVLTALSRRPPAGAAAGFSLGLLRDLLGRGPLGLETLLLTLVGGWAGSMSRSFYRDAGMTRALMLFTGGILHAGLRFAVLGEGGLPGLWGYGWRYALPTAVTTAAVVTLLVHLLQPDRLRRLRSRLRRRRRRSAAHDAPIPVEQP